MWRDNDAILNLRGSEKIHTLTVTALGLEFFSTYSIDKDNIPPKHVLPKCKNQATAVIIKNMAFYRSCGPDPRFQLYPFKLGDLD